MFLVRYEHHLHLKSRAIPEQVVKAYRVVRCCLGSRLTDGGEVVCFWGVKQCKYRYQI
jgi:hypothetical protein